jgi:uncharacterized protein (DUF2062 family)
MCSRMVAIEGLTCPHAVEHPISLVVVISLEWELGLALLSGHAVSSRAKYILIW